MDRVSNLPDEIICHILSFLTTNEAALTSVLSKKWRNLFALVPNLDICYFEPLSLIEDDSDGLGKSFMDSIDRVLTLQGNSPIKNFSLEWTSCTDPDRVDAWIINVLVRGVSELYLSVYLNSDRADKYFLSPKIFESKKLVKLEICGGIDIGLFDDSIFLPMLKTLVLESVYVDDTFEFLRALHALEELVLVYVYSEIWDVTLSSASLKTLTIDNSPIFKFSLDTPSLVSFYHSGYVPDFSLGKMDNLFEARISLSPAQGEIDRVRAPNNYLLGDDDMLGIENLGNLMNGIRNVPYLNLCPNILEVLSLCVETMPLFNNLKSLAIKSDESRGWQAMPVLLRKCPHLETLVIQGLSHHVTDKCGDACDCASREDKGRSLTSCPVKVLEIQGVRGTMKERHMIKHFLDYFPCLKEIKIYIEEDDSSTQLGVLKVSQVIAEMIKLHRKLTSCNVQLLVSGCLYKKWTAQ